MLKFIHKINGIGKSSLSVILPMSILKDLNIVKGDWVEINQRKDIIIIRKIRLLNSDRKKIDFKSTVNGYKNSIGFNNTVSNDKSLKNQLKKAIPANQSLETSDKQVSIVKGDD